MDPSQVSFLKQGKMPCLKSVEGEMVQDPDSPYKISTKPHGDGEVHSLLHSSGVASSWKQAGKKWVVFLQDCNGLGFFSLPACLGVSIKLNLKVNCVAVPRKSGQDLSSLVSLKHSDGRSIVAALRPHQLQALLKSTEGSTADANNSSTGFSPYLGLTNQMIMELDSYLETLGQTQGVVQEVVEPVFEGEDLARPVSLQAPVTAYSFLVGGKEGVGYTSCPSWACHAPLDNSLEVAKELVAQGMPANSASAAEAGQYRAFAEVLKILGATVEMAEDQEYAGIPVSIGPLVVMEPSFATCPQEMRARFPSPENIKISSKSVLIVRGEGVVVERLDLDGSVLLDAEEGAKLTVRQLVVKNNGAKLLAHGPDATPDVTPEVALLRGYNVAVPDMRDVVISKAQGAVLIEETDEGLGAGPPPVPTERQYGCVVALLKWMGFM
uniref:Uncharacterized protein n=1 Tax=Fibrocapsa japonica TaxID=94617 RepID=A0A7S2V323_9STRA